MTVFWTQFAEDKLEDIFVYHKFKAGSRTAKSLVNGIIDTTLSLEHSPYIGQIEELLLERIEGFRYLISKNYKIIYWIDRIHNKVFISNIFDTRQNPDKVKITP